MDDERALVSRCVSFDASAWAELVRRHTPGLSARVCQVYAARARRGPTEDELREILQDTFVRLAANGARALAAFEWRASLAGYLSVIAASCALGRIRRDAGRRSREGVRLDLLLASGAAADPRPGPEEAALDREAALAVEEAVDGLPEQERTVIRMRYWEGAPESAVARLLGVSERYVREILRRGEERIRRVLARAEKGSG